MRILVNPGKFTPLLDQELKVSDPSIKLDEIDVKSKIM